MRFRIDFSEIERAEDEEHGHTLIGGWVSVNDAVLRLSGTSHGEPVWEAVVPEIEHQLGRSLTEEETERLDAFDEDGTGLSWSEQSGVLWYEIGDEPGGPERADEDHPKVEHLGREHLDALIRLVSDAPFSPVLRDCARILSKTRNRNFPRPLEQKKED